MTYAVRTSLKPNTHAEREEWERSPYICGLEKIFEVNDGRWCRREETSPRRGAWREIGYASEVVDVYFYCVGVRLASLRGSVRCSFRRLVCFGDC